MPSIHVIAYGFPPCTEAGARSLLKLLYPLNRDADFKLKLTTADPVMYAERDNSLAGYTKEFEINYVRWRWQRPYELLNYVFQWHTDPYVLFAGRCREILLAEKPADLYLLRGQHFSTFVLAPFIRRHLQRPVVLYYSDPWLVSPYLSLSARLKKRVARLEAMALEAASGAIFTNAQAQRETLQNYPSAHLRTLVLPHVYLKPLYENPAAESNDEIRLTFAGNFYGNRQPFALFKAMAELKREKNDCLNALRLRLIGPNKSYYQARLRDLGLEAEVHFPGSMSYLETLRHLQASDILVNIDAASEASLFLPSKLIDYFGCKLPIWTLSPPGPAASLVAEYGGLVSLPEDLQAIKQDLLRSLERTRKRSWNLNPAFAEQFESQKVYPRLKSFLQTILEKCSA